MTAPPTALPNEKMDARAYGRAHEGKWMIVDRTDGRASATADFFQIESVGTHPTGLMVTGRFENNQRNHLMAAAVREANPSEIERLRAAQGNSPTPARPGSSANRLRKGRRKIHEIEAGKQEDGRSTNRRRQSRKRSLECLAPCLFPAFRLSLFIPSPLPTPN